jgi:hypothetical protein
MEKQQRIAQLYGYAVCLVAVITFLISTASVVGAIFDLSDPLHATGFGFGVREPSLASFENYKVDVLKSTQQEKQLSAPAYVPDDQTLHAMYEAAKTERIQTVSLRARRTITVSSLLILVCIALFTTHWTWLRRLARKEAAAG